MAQANTSQTDASQTDASQAPTGMTAAAAAKLVFREVPATGKDGQPTGKVEKVAVGADEVLDFADHGDHVVVVTVDGQKFTGQKKAAK